MSERFTFPIAEVGRAKDRARTASANLAQPDREPEGTLDPGPVLESCDSLRLRPGWKLRAYVARHFLGNDARVVAVPTDVCGRADVPRLPFDAPRLEADEPYMVHPRVGGIHVRSIESPSDGIIRVPVGARRRFMSVVEGDGSPLSYLCASLIVRELLDVGASWHSLYWYDWFEHRIVATWPRCAPSPEVRGPQLNGGEGMAAVFWSLPYAESELRVGDGVALHEQHPEVVVDAGCVTVRFLTYRPPTAVAEGVWLHEDRYEAGSYDPVLSRELVEQGQARRWYY